MKKHLLTFVLIILLITFADAQNPSRPKLNQTEWNIIGDAQFEDFKGQETLVLNGKATLKNVEFTNGIIEVDIYANSKRSFAGILFRKQGNSMEEVYMRMHKSRQVDAVQYSPTFNNELTWQLYREYQAQVTFKHQGWNKLRLEVNHSRLDIFVNNEKVLTVLNMRTESKSGELGLFALYPNRFANFRYIQKKVPSQNNEFMPKTKDAHLISDWSITPSRPYQEQKFKLTDSLARKSFLVRTDETGLLPISKYLSKTSRGNFEENEESYTIASTIINSKNEHTEVFSFDFSDKAIVFLNDRLIFKGNNSFRAKGVQYMGHLNVDTNQLYLLLKKGENKLQIVVIDKANGWGLIGKLKEI